METKKLSEEQVKKLQAPLPAEAVKPHPTKSYLSSIKAIYVVERLNQVFGIGTWKLKSEIVDDKTDMVVVKSVLSIPEYGIELESFGGNDNGGEGSKNFDKGDAYKGATTDALTKICSFLEIGIDVFKGKNAPAGTTGSASKSSNNDLPWLNEGTKEYNGAIEKLKLGTTTLESIEKFFKLSKSIKSKLVDAASQPA